MSEDRAVPPPRRPRGDIIRASEIGEYVYCRRAWWLGRIQGRPNANYAQLEAGTARHHLHGQITRRVEALTRIALLLAILAAVSGLLLILALLLR